MCPEENDVFTIGHSSMQAEEFTGLLSDHDIKLLIDVRSQPVSGRFPHFNGTPLGGLVEGRGIGYLFLGEELGGRPDDLQHTAQTAS
jgi:uncharacterized protein (DUF488 family)